MAAKNLTMWIQCLLDCNQVLLPTLWGGSRRPHGKEGLSSPPGGNEHSPHPWWQWRPCRGSFHPHPVKEASPPLLSGGKKAPSPLWAGVTRSQMGQCNFHGHPLMRRSPPLYSVRGGHKEAWVKCLPTPTWVVSVQAWWAEKSFFHQAVVTWNTSFTPTPAPSPMLVEVEVGEIPTWQ